MTAEEATRYLSEEGIARNSVQMITLVAQRVQFDNLPFGWILSQSDCMQCGSRVPLFEKAHYFRG